MSWFSSWLPALPSLNFPVPANIQGRLLSFALKRLLGHLLKPGQLESAQIDSQLGSGHVQIKDLELDERAINGYLQSTPLTLEAGSLQAITVDVGSAIRLTARSLHLQFRINAAPCHAPRQTPNLADSVASVAETFLHDELTDQEEAGLWESVHSAAETEDDGNGVPGGLDPFATNEDEAEPAGVSLFASLIEKILARLECDAQDVQISITDPSNMTLRFRLARFSTSTSSSTELSGIRRTIALEGIQVFTKNQFSTIPSSPSTAGPSSPTKRGSSPSTNRSPHSSTSSLDEETELQMSQSIAMLPPRSISPTDSLEGSIYHSMVDTSTSITSGVPSPPPHQEDASDGQNNLEECLLTLGESSIHIVTPAPGEVPIGHGLGKERYMVEVNLGVLACAVQPWQICGIGHLAKKFSGASEASSGPREGSRDQSPRSWCLDLSLELEGVCVLLSPSFDNTSEMDKYFSRPLVPPSLTTGYTRLVVESGSGQASISSTFEDIAFDATISDISIFQFLPKPSSSVEEKDPTPPVVPVMITDPLLPRQYDSAHFHPTETDPFDSSRSQPTLQVTDWKSRHSVNHGSKASNWRYRPSQRKGTHTTSKDGPATQEPCLSLSFHRSAPTRSKKQPAADAKQQIELRIVPIHLFLDLHLAQLHGGILSFVQHLTIEQSTYASAFSSTRLATFDSDSAPSQSSSDDETTDAAAKQKGPLDYPRNPKATSAQSSVSLDLAMIRFSVTVPPPPGRPRRSGVLVVDVHDIDISNSSPSPPPEVRFDLTASHRVPRTPGNCIAQFRFRRLLLACSTVSEPSALAILSVGSLGDDQVPGRAPLLPLIKIFTSDVGIGDEGDPRTTVHIDIPSVYSAVGKDQWDSLQYWIDDMTQALERMNSGQAVESLGDSKGTSIIGSRYFTKSQRGSTLGSSNSSEATISLAISASVTELFVRVNLPRDSPDGVELRPFNIKGSDIGAHVEVHAGGKFSALVTMMDTLVQDTTSSGHSRTFLSLTSPQSLTSIPRPLVKVRFISSVIPETMAKENKISVSLSNFTLNAYPDIQWLHDFTAFMKAPPGTFEVVAPTERTCISVKIVNGSVRAFAPTHPGALVLSAGGLHLATDIIGDAPDSSFRVDIASLAVLAIDDLNDVEPQRSKGETDSGVVYWKTQGYALLAEISSSKIHYHEENEGSPARQVLMDGMKLRIHACADTFASVSAFVSDLGSYFGGSDGDDAAPPPAPEPAVLSPSSQDPPNLTGSIDESAFKRPPEIGPTPDMIYDDLPTNLDYLDESFGAAAGLRELTDDDLDEFDIRDIANPSAPVSSLNTTGIVSSVGGETIRLLQPEGINVIEGYYDDIPREDVEEKNTCEDEELRVRIRNCDVKLLLYEGYDWPRTRRTIEEEVKEMRKRLAKIRQLVASGQTQEPIPDYTSSLLFNSVYIGLHQDVDTNEPDALMAAIDEELHDDFDTATQSSWQTIQQPTSTAPAAPRGAGVRVQGKKLTRSRGPSMEFCLSALNMELNKYGENSVVASRTFVAVRDLEILDHIKTSTWKKFLTALRSDAKGNIRETGASMAKILPLRLYVDQDAVDFLKKFFSFKDSQSASDPSPSAPPDKEAYIQMAEIFPIDLKLDYKPRRVDYRALREGRTIELMNFFHFDGAEMTLRHITLSGISGWARMFEMLNDLWTPDVKATQLVDVISGVSPIRSMVNVGSGVADLVLLPISQYRKDGRIVRGVQRGATAFVRSTALEAIKLGARLATGTQVILEQAEGILGGEFDQTITTEALQQQPIGDEFMLSSEEEFGDDAEHISKYAQQPADIKEGVQSAYKSLSRNLSSAAQTILAVPMEVYERSGNEGPVRSVIRAVPIAVLKPMIGATEAVSKTLLGLHNTLDPEIRHENEAKYKNR